MSISALAWAFDQALTPTRKLILLSLANRVDDQNRCFASMGVVRVDTGLNRKRVIGSISELEEKKFLKVDRYTLIGVQKLFTAGSKNSTGALLKNGTGDPSTPVPETGPTPSRKRY